MVTSLLLGATLLGEVAAEGFPAVINLGSLDGSDGFRLDGETVGDDFGFDAKAAGDVNNDGIDDVVVGAYRANHSGQSAGSSYVIYGRRSGFPATFPVSGLDGSNGFRLDGVAAGDRSGTSVSAAGDVNADGIDDLIIGAGGADPNGDRSGSAFVVFGRSGGFPATVPLAGLDGANGFRMNGVDAVDSAGRTVSDVGDINGDGIDDVIVGAYFASPNGFISGTAYVVFGKASPVLPVLELADLNGSNGFRMEGLGQFHRIGRSADGIGDINGDGIDDLIVGSYEANGLAGSSYVVFGRTSGFSALVDLAALNGGNGFRIDGASAQDLSGRSVSAAGDFNADGIDDLLIGADGYGFGSIRSGSGYVVFGRQAPFPAVLPLSSLDGSNGVRFGGESEDDDAGFSVGAAGDVNGDGIDDIIIGADSADSNGEDSGSSYVVFGSQLPFPAMIPLASLDGSNGFRLDGTASGDTSGWQVNDAGDINDDGVGDVIIGNLPGTPNGTLIGTSYVVFGRHVDRVFRDGFGQEVTR